MGAYSPNIIANSLICCRTYNGSGEYFIHGDRRITWDEIGGRAFKLSQELLRLGVKKGDKVAFMFHNSPYFVEINFAVQMIGAIPTPMNYRYAPPEIEFQVNHSDSKCVIYDEQWAKTMKTAAANMPKVNHIICRGKCGLADALDYEALISQGEDKDPQIPTDWDDLAVMIYTGGTTGRPKGVMLSYRSHLDMWATLTSQIAVRFISQEIPKERHQKMVEALPISGKKIIGPLLRTRAVRSLIKKPFAMEGLRKLYYRRLSDPDAAKKNYKNNTKAMYASMPFFHISGFANLMLSMLVGNFTYVTTESVSFDPERILSLIQREKISTLTNVPTGWRKLVSYKDFHKFDVSSVRTAGTGGGPCAKSLKKEMMKKFPNAMVIDTFGQTEMTPVTSFKLDVDSDNITDRSVGQSIVQTKIVDEKGNEVSQGQVGEIMYFSTTVMKGYYKEEEKTQEVLKDGWFKSGDLGYFDENGELRVVDRKKECINTGGEKVFPLEVEEVIETHPNVEFACVIGIPDEEWGNTIRAIIQLRNGINTTEEEIADLCRNHLAGYKIPRSMVFVPQLPFSPAGKKLRQQVKENWGAP